MNPDFCVGCNSGSSLPSCAIGIAPSNAYIENIINNDIVSTLENFICHKTAQDLSSGKLNILSNCDDCGMCQIMCPNSNIDYTTFFNSKLEKVLFNDFGRASILFQKIFPDSLVATEVQVNGNFRTKRIDLLIKKGNDVYLIKMLKSTDKIPFYMHSYDKVIEQYHTTYPNISFYSLFLVPANKINDIVRVNAEIVDLATLNRLIGGN